MERTLETSENHVVLNGIDSALITAALFALAEWPFETVDAKELATREMRLAGQTLSEVVSERWRLRLDEVGLWNSASGWTPELIAKRAALKRGVSLALAELPLAIVALNAVAEEFSSNWSEFCTVIPGAMAWYSVGSPDVARLARHLKSAPAGC
jgi:hypothetical protein